MYNQASGEHGCWGLVYCSYCWYGYLGPWSPQCCEAYWGLSLSVSLSFFIFFHWFYYAATKCGFFWLWKKDGSLDELVRKRYQSFDTELGAQIEVICVSNILLIVENWLLVLKEVKPVLFLTPGTCIKSIMYFDSFWRLESCLL